MPAVTQVILYDDQHWPEEVKADEVVQLTVVRQPVDGGDPVKRTVVLYLTGTHAGELDKGLDSWFALGHKHGNGEASRKRNWAGGSRQASVDRHRKIREFLAERDIRSRVDPSRLAFETPGGKASYPEWAVEMYDQWVADGQPPQRKAG